MLRGTARYRKIEALAAGTPEQWQAVDDAAFASHWGNAQNFALNIDAIALPNADCGEEAEPRHGGVDDSSGRDRVTGHSWDLCTLSGKCECIGECKYGRAGNGAEVPGE